ncbi:MerR family transcriptional regulator [Hyphobacterium marinum]|uniref:MerR family transcriptional regulator n=1 Tax=Hyphobacterium marinum TaxID=3116574 RepID=A0ABU7LYN5_9PROT|nr:MerR family transcriptional regulator [Hyphobacterium sp. Y6023]MEE2566662.1 MerR family transcriptional regulator [Hyphobacterium sp. Y6023]
MADKSPDAYRSISEAASELDLPAHVLRFWESKFPQLKPVKRAGGRRFYRPGDIALLRGIKRLLYEDGFTIKGAQKYVREQGVAAVGALAAEDGTAEPEAPRLAERYVPSSQPAAPASAGSGLAPVLERLEHAKKRLDDALAQGR